MPDRPHWLPLSASDIESVDKIAAAIHPGLAERPEIMAEKINLFPMGCRKLVLHGVMMGYALAHPWTLFSAPALDEFIVSIPKGANCVHIHDIAVLPEARGRRCIEDYVALVRTLAAELNAPKLACVSVYDTEALWARYGFEVDARGPARGALAAYGPTARYMTADVRERTE
jgi:hypothetical protein